MAINTILLDFSVDPAKLELADSRSSLQSDAGSILCKFIPGLSQLYTTDVAGESFIVSWSGPGGCVVTLRAFKKQGLVSVNIEYYKSDEEKQLITFEQCRLLESSLRAALASSRGKLLPPLRRGAALDVYMTTSGKRIRPQQVRSLEADLAVKLSSRKSHKYPAFRRGGNFNRFLLSSDERLLEYDIDDLIFEEKSPFQKVQILHSASFGNMLVLDDLQNLADSDLVYTETLMQRGKEVFKDKEVLILGGGDGALLWELLKEAPKFVTMLEIDDVVMSACKVHMRKCCGTCLDSMTGNNYEIIVEDCVAKLDSYIAEGRTFDYVFGDLTDIPLSPTPQGQVWDFIRLILNKALLVLRSTGKFMTHGNGSSCPAALAMYEQQLEKLDTPVEFSKDHAFVPSFMEDWVFYQVWHKH